MPDALIKISYSSPTVALVNKLQLSRSSSTYPKALSKHVYYACKSPVTVHTSTFQPEAIDKTMAETIDEMNRRRIATLRGITAHRLYMA